MKGPRVRIMEFMSIRYFRGGILLAAACCAGAWAQQYNISTVAGTGGAPGFADGNALLTALLSSPASIALDPKNSGNLYIADSVNHRIRLLTGGKAQLASPHELRDLSAQDDIRIEEASKRSVEKTLPQAGQRPGSALFEGGGPVPVDVPSADRFVQQPLRLQRRKHPSAETLRRAVQPAISSRKVDCPSHSVFASMIRSVRRGESGRR